jgi:hypothetical protein
MVAAVAVVSTLVISPAARAGRRAGEITSDVSVRKWPASDAPVVRELEAGAPVIGHERRQGWVRITGAGKGWIPVEAFGTLGSDEDQRRKLLSELSAAANADAEPEDKTDADLMYDALKQWRGGETPDSATIDRVLAQSKKEADRTRREVREKVKQMFWKDPFSDQPQKLLLVRKEDRELVERARIERRGRRVDTSASEVAQLRAELAAARDEAARAKAELARVLAKYEALASRGVESRDDAVAVDSETVPRRARRSHRRSADQMQAFNSSPAPRSERKRTASAGAWQAVADRNRVALPEPAPAEQVNASTVATMPAGGWRSNDTRGIIVVPIESPIPIKADPPKKKR